jgi:hypothetical protein
MSLFVFICTKEPRCDISQYRPRARSITLYSFLFSIRYIADLQIPEACKSFVREYGNEIVREKLCRNFLLHLVNLNDFNILGKAQLLQTIELLDEVRHS